MDLDKAAEEEWQVDEIVLTKEQSLDRDHCIEVSKDLILKEPFLTIGLQLGVQVADRLNTNSEAALLSGALDACSRVMYLVAIDKLKVRMQ